MSSLVLTVSHPASLAGLLIGVALITRALLGVYSLRWFLYLLALVFLGGVIVVLLFIVSVCANEKFYRTKRVSAWLRRVLALGSLLIIQPHLNMRSSFNGFQFSCALYEIEGALSFILFMCILILCLVRVVGVSSLEAGPLVKRL